MLEVIRQETQRIEHETLGMFALIIMTHGSELELFGTDNKGLNKNEVFHRLSAKNFKYMAGKPKLVLIQACSGG